MSPLPRAAAFVIALSLAAPGQAKKPRAAKAGQRPEVVVQAGAKRNAFGKVEGFGAFVLSTDGRLLAAYEGREVQLFEADTGLLLRTIDVGGTIDKLAFSDDGRQLAALVPYTFLGLWEVETGRLIKRIETKANEDFLFLGPNQVFSSERIYDRDTDKTTYRTFTLDLRSGKELPPPPGLKKGELLIGRDPKGRLWVRSKTFLAAIDPRSKKRVIKIDVPENEPALFSADYERYATRKEGGDLRIVETRTGALLRTFPLAKGAGLGSVFFSPDGSRLIADISHEVVQQDVHYSPDSYLHSWSLETGAEEPPRKMPIGGAIAPGGRVLIGEGRFLDISTGQPIRRQFEALARVHQLSFSSDGRRLLASESPINDIVKGDARVWDLSTGRLVQNIAARGARFNADASAILAGIYGGGLTLLDARTLAPIKELKSDGRQIENGVGVAFSPDGKWAAIEKNWTTIIELPSGKTVTKLRGWFPHWSADSKRLALGASAQAVVYETGTWKPLATCGTTFMSWDLKAIALSPDGALVAAAREGGGDSSPGKSEVRIYETATCRERRLLQIPDTIVNQNELAFSPDGTKLVLNPLHVWNVATGDELRLPELERGVGAAFAFRPGHPAQLVTSGGGAIVLWDLNKLQPLATFYGFDGEWLTLLPDNRYAASRGALQHLAFRVGARAFPFEQFDLRFNRPDAVLEALGASPARIEAARAAVRKRLKRSGFTEEQLSGDLQLPELQLRSQPPPSTKERNLEISVRAEDASALLDRLVIAVNDVPIVVDLKDKRTRKLSEKASIPLSIGKNLIQVSVLNARGVESLRRTFETIYDASAKKPDLYVVAVGVSTYKDSDKSLRYAAKDAGDLAGFFQKNSSGFGAVKVLKLLDGDATKEKIAAAKDFLKPSTVDDQAVVFFAGHGLRDDKLDYYFATADIDFRNPSARGLPYEVIEGLLDGIGARKKLLLIDTCNSGELDKDEATLVASNETRTSEGLIKSRGVKVVQTKAQPLGIEGSADLLEDLFADLRRGSGAVAIASAGGAEFALESDAWKNGVFTYALLSTLGAGKSRVSEVRDAVTKKVTELTAGKQRPTVRRENLAVDFAIY